MRIAYITNAESNSGVGHRALNIARRLKRQVDIELDVFGMNGEEMTVKKNGVQVAALTKWPGALGAKSVGWLRLGRVVRKEIAKGGYNVVHLTNQTLSFLTRKIPRPVVVTVHDIIEVLDPQTKGAYWLNRYLYSGITKASCVIAVSEYTAQTLRDYYGLPAERLTVIYNGVGKEFHVIDNFKQTIAYQILKQELKLADGARVVLYVGSDHPRKNVAGAIRAFAQVQKKIPGLVFVKVGKPGIAAGRGALLEEIERLGLREKVRFVGDVTEEKLNDLYNLADILIYPSKFEGFGLPPLQALAAGTPVVCSNATSLPEVVGEAALTHDPDDIEAWGNSLQRVLESEELAGRLKVKGLERALTFSWDEAADKVKSVYRRVT